MDFPMTQEESYDDRRKLFKNIWDTAMTLEDKDASDVISKPKVIKTLRLGEVDRIPIGKKKKQRLKNLRTVCNKLLDFCDRQDADDLFYEQLAAEGKEAPPRHAGVIPNLSKKPKVRIKKKFKSEDVFARVATTKTTSERQGDFKGNEPGLNSQTKRHSITFKTKLSKHHNLENAKKEGKDKKRTLHKPIDLTPGVMKFKYVTITRTMPVPKPPKKLLNIHKINIT